MTVASQSASFEQAADHAGVDLATVQFVLDSLNITFRRMEVAAPQDAWETAVYLAFGNCGQGALDWLSRCRIPKARDFGRVVFALAETDLVRTHADDSLADFEKAPTAEALLAQCRLSEAEPSAVILEASLRCRCWKNLRYAAAHELCGRCGRPVGRAILREWKRLRRDYREFHPHERNIERAMANLQRYAAYRARLPEFAGRIAWEGIYLAQCLRWNTRLLPLRLEPALIHSGVLLQAMLRQGTTVARTLELLKLKTGADVGRLTQQFHNIGLLGSWVNAMSFDGLPTLVALDAATAESARDIADMAAAARRLSRSL